MKTDELCGSWHEWRVNKGMGDTCLLKIGHEGAHRDARTGATWERTSEEKRLVALIVKLNDDIFDLRCAFDER